MLTVLSSKQDLDTASPRLKEEHFSNMKTVSFASWLAVSTSVLRTANASLSFYAMGACRKRLVDLLCGVIPCCLPCCTCFQRDSHIGDVPYNDAEADNLVDQIDGLSVGDALFTVHLGDYNTPATTGCSASHFERIADILSQGPVTTFVLAGDNDYLDCPSPNAAWSHYKNTFVGFEDGWNSSIDVDRKSGGPSSRPGGSELFAFYEEGVLFVSTVLMNGGGWSSRASASKSWIQEKLRDYKDENDFRGVIIFSHAEGSSNLEDFFDDIEDIFGAEEVDVPVLYLCGDRHRYVRQKGYNGWDQLDYVSVDKGGCANPILVEVADDGDSFGSGGDVFGGGLYKINRRGGRYVSSRCR